MDKAEEIFAEGIEDRNVKTIRQARVLFVICLMAGMFIIFESDDIFKWAAVLAVYFFTDSFYKKYLRVEANLADDMTGNDIYQFIGQHALSVDCYFGIISKKICKYRIIFLAEYFLCAIFSDSKGYGLIIAVLSVVVTYATAWIKKKYFICRLVGRLKPVEMILTFTDSFFNIFKFLLILLVSLLFCVVFLGVAEDAVKRLMKKGHKKIGMITGPDNVYTARERQRGYKLALQESSKAQSEQQSDLKDKTDRKDTKLLADGNYTIAGGAKAMRKLYEDNPDMTAVFISNYEMTVGAMMEINDLGIKVPKQLSVIGFDNVDFARAVVPRLSIVTQPTEEIGQAAANLLLSRLEDKDETSDKTSDKIETTETIWLKTGFVEGESVADIS